MFVVYCYCYYYYYFVIIIIIIVVVKLKVEEELINIAEYATTNIFFTVSYLYSDYVRGFRLKVSSPTK